MQVSIRNLLLRHSGSGCAAMCAIMSALLGPDNGALWWGGPTMNSYSSNTNRSNMHSSPVGWPGPPGPAGPVQFPPLLTPAAPTSASFASPSALIPWAADRGEGRGRH